MKVNDFIKINYKLNMKLFFGDFIIFNKLIKKINNCIKILIELILFFD